METNWITVRNNRRKSKSKAQTTVVERWAVEWTETEIQQSLVGIRYGLSGSIEEKKHLLLRSHVQKSAMWVHNRGILESILRDHPGLTTIGALVMYGLGSLSQRISRYQVASRYFQHLNLIKQLAFLLEMMVLFPNIQWMEAYDPLFTDADAFVLEQLGIHVLSENDQCRRRLDVSSLVVMPHIKVHGY